jgi:hypothetical protein
LRPAGAETWNAGIYRLHVRNAFLGTRSPAMSELAEDWNRLHRVAEERRSR